MPIDPTIPLSIAPPPNALATFDAIQNMGALADQRRQLAAERQAQVDKLQQQQEQQAQFQQIIHESVDPTSGVVDWDAAYQKMDERGLSTLAQTLKKNAAEALQAQAKTTGDLLDNHQKTLNQLTSEMRAVRDSGSQGAWQQLVTHVAQAFNPSIAASMPTTPQAAEQAGWFDKATTWADSEENDINRVKALTEAASAKPRDAQAWTNHGAQVLGASDPTVTDPNNPMSYQFRLGLLSLQGMPSPILQQFKGLTSQQAGQMGVSADKSAEMTQQAAQAQTTADRMAAAQAETARHNRVTEADAQQRIALTGGGPVDPDTVASYVRQVQAGNLPLQNVPANYRGPVTNALPANTVAKLTTQGRLMKETASTLLPMIDKVQSLAQQIDAAGLMGSIGGRERSFASLESGAADMKGLTPQQRQLVGEFASAGGLLITGIARAHGGARAGGSPQMIEHLSKLMDAGNKDINTFLGNLAGERDFMQAYAGMGEAAPPTTGGGATPPPGAKIEKWVIDPKTGQLVKGGG